MPRVLLVVGGSSDIGMEAISELMEAFNYIIVHYNHMNSKLELLVKKALNKCILIQADLSTEEGISKLISEIRNISLTPTDIIHLPAMAYQARKFHKTPWEILQKEINISLRSAVEILQVFLPEMTKTHYGKVVIMLSMVVNGMPPKHNADYVIVKHALWGLVKSLAVEYADKGISINGISPALVKTKFVDGMHEYLIQQNAGQSPTGSNLTISEVVPTIKFLLSDEAACINGQNISITCGR